MKAALREPMTLAIALLAGWSYTASAQIQRQEQSFGARPGIERPENDARSVKIPAKKTKSCEEQSDEQELTGDTREVFLQTCASLKEGKVD